ncbi:sirohydrochlorin chelatase [Effusibacillus lacus]|uniref:Sirohydrochlorin chelatase n=1 Tax=Effusibacillus lacus TaxID=1348429 RepID=A0A292YQ41_9BACL|nr:sirohydrochlorin chelatase [Effusibacillus lacus]TCS75702.1 sirohydrochlorin cobaltochelatase [Effusibacillus lacus]GAX91021.1 sirohydrochlorin chelatase [Effusibacillus lacus]
MSEAVLLIGHGSRDPEGNAEFAAFVEKLKELRSDIRIDLAYLELARPTIGETIDRLAAEGVSRITAVPVILLAAGHVKAEIPHILDEARKRHPHLDIQYGRHLGLHEQVLNILEERLAEAEQEGQDRKDTTVLLVGRGSSDADANGDLYKLSRILWERTGVAGVEVCFIGVTYPDFPGGVRRAAAAGTSHVIVLPYFLFTGVLMKRMESMLQELSPEFPAVSFALANYFGYHPGLLEIVSDRMDEVATGGALMNCDMCKYRLQAAHHHHHDHGHHHHHHDHHGHEHHHDHASHGHHYEDHDWQEQVVPAEAKGHS